MFKRILLLLLTLMLLCGGIVHAEQSYDKIGSAMYRIVLRTEKGDTTLGSGVLFMDRKILLTAEGCCREGQLYAIGMDGEHAILDWKAKEGLGVALMELATPSSAEPLALTTTDSKSLPFIFGVNAAGSAGSVPLYLVRKSMHQGQDALLLTGEEGLLPGGFMTDAQGNLVGMVIAQQMEGVGSYVALDANELYTALVAGQNQNAAYLECKLTWQSGMLIVNWQDAVRDSGLYVITISGDHNNYYTTYEADQEHRSIELLVPPGHTYEVQVQWAPSKKEAPTPVWNAMKSITIPALPFASYGYTQSSSLCSVPAGQEVKTELTAMPVISVDTLTDKAADIYLQVRNSFDVDAVVGVPMAFELIAPDGQFFYEEMRYTLSPEHEKDDSFVLLVDDLMASCAEFAGGIVKAGDYVLRYALNGKIAGEYAFTVLPAGTPAPTVAPTAAPTEKAPATSGFASGVHAEEKNGLITLTWDEASIPGGAKVSVYYLYEGNTYYTYHAMKEGVHETGIFTVPGRKIMAWVSWSTQGEPAPGNPKENECVIIQAAEESPFQAHDFKNLRIGLMPSDDPAAGTKMTWIPQQPLTREILSDRDTPLYFQTEDCYHISATTEDHPMVIVLITPEGLCFVDPGYYIFDLTMQSSDQWLKDVSKLFADYESLVHGEAYPAGEYRVLYCIDGKMAGEYTFTLK